ncbi:glycosyltransferase [Paenibacillus sp. FSL L8-0689]|uniref:glycosyltransferase n=1 Tax=Paenibacillus sp. FSL L8-0689 TaxID=2921607 RepID=UPI0030F5AC5E
MEAKVAIIMRTKNRLILLNRAIQSVISQTYDNWEIQLINNGGDIVQLQHLLKQYGSDVLKKIKVTHTKSDLYMEVATNIGLANSKAEYITLLDDDDTWSPDFLRVCIESLEENKEFDGVVTLTYLIHEEIFNGNITQKFKTIFNPKLKRVSLLKIAKGNLFTTNSFVYRRKALGLTGEYREDLPVLGDWEFNIRFIFNCNVGVITEPLSNYHKRIVYDNSSYNNSNIQQHIQYDYKLRMEYFRKIFKGGYFILGFTMLSFGFVNSFKRLVKKIFKRFN